MSQLVYLAFPIDQANGWAAYDIGHVKAVLAAAGISSFDPHRGFSLGGEWPAAAIASVNRIAQAHASGTLAWLPEGVCTFGVPVEIERALRLEQAVAIVHGSQPSVQLADWQRRGAGLFDTGEHAVEWLVDEIQQKPQDLVQRIAEAEADDEVAKVRNLANHNVAIRSRLPTRVHPGDAGYDLYVSRATIIKPGEFVDVHCDIAIELPEDMWGWIVGRSSTLRQSGLLVNQGIIDQGYRGELMAGVWNLSKDIKSILPGDRIAQFIPMPLLAEQLRMQWAGELSPSARGGAGFGSSGT